MTAETPSKSKPGKAPKAKKPTAPISARVRVYSGGMSLGLGASFLVVGYDMMNGIDAFTSSVWGLFTFFAIGLVSWFVAVTFGPALEEASKNRARAQIGAVRNVSKSGVVESSLGLMGGVDPSYLSPGSSARARQGGPSVADANFQDLGSLLRDGATGTGGR